MADLPNVFPAQLAYLPGVGPLRNAAAEVYDPEDTDFSDPLPITDLAGVPMADLAANDDGVFDSFVVDSVTEYLVVYAKSGEFITPVRSLVGARGPAGEAGPAGVGIPDTTDATSGDAIVWNGTTAVWQPIVGGGGAGDWNSITGKPSTFPAESHSHPVSQVSDATTVGRLVMTAADAQAARAAIGAGTGNGTSNLTLGTSATTAMPGNRAFGSTEISRAAGGGLTSTTVEGALVELAGSIGSGGSGTSSILVVKWASGAYPSLPTTKPSGVYKIEFIGPNTPTSGNVSGGIPAYVGLGSTQIPAFYTVAALS